LGWHISLKLYLRLWPSIKSICLILHEHVQFCPTFWRISQDFILFKSVQEFWKTSFSYGSMCPRCNPIYNILLLLDHTLQHNVPSFGNGNSLWWLFWIQSNDSLHNFQLSKCNRRYISTNLQPVVGKILNRTKFGMDHDYCYLGSLAH